MDGWSDLVVEINQGFKGDIPWFVLEVIGGTKAVKEAIKDVQRKERRLLKGDEEQALLEIDPEYHLGMDDGYGELLDEIVEVYKDKEMPEFMKKKSGVTR